VALAGYGTKFTAWALRSKLSASVIRRERFVYGWAAASQPFSDFYGIQWNLATGAMAATESAGLDWLHSTGHVTVEVRFGSQGHPSGGLRFGAQLYSALAAPSSTGSLAATESGSDTFAGAGAVVVTGSATLGDSADTLAAAGTVPVSGALSVTEAGSDTLAGSGAVAVAGSLASAESGSDALSVIGAVAVTGSMSTSETGLDSLAASGIVFSGGLLAAIELGSDALSSGGSVAVTGSLAWTESGPDVLASTGVVPIAGTIAATETSADQLAGLGGVAIVGALAVQEAGNDSLEASGSPSYAGDMAAVEQGADSFAAIYGLPELFGSFNVIEAADRFRARGSTLSTSDGSYMLRELIFIGRNNVAQIRIGQNKTAIDFGGVTRMVLVLQGSNVRVDSAIDNEAIEWDNSGTIRLRLGAYPIKPSRYWASIIGFDPEHDDGQLIVDADDAQLQLWCVNS
jgi:hypothetical protein